MRGPHPTLLVYRCTCGGPVELVAEMIGRGVESGPERLGDVAICSACGRAYVFGSGMQLLALDVSQLEPEPRRQVQQSQAQIRARGRLAPERKDAGAISVDTPDGTITGHPDAVREAVASFERVREQRRRWPQRPDGTVDKLRAMSALAQSFPTLRTAAGVEPWDVDRFIAWLCGGASHGAMHAGRFVLGVWNSGTDWIEVARERGLDGADALSRFDLFAAVGTWDAEHRAACWRWMEAPFWP